MNIISLVPSLTELVCDLGLSGSLVGCTPFCTHPPGALSQVTRVRGPKDPCIESIRCLKPDKILVNSEENLSLHIKVLSEICEVLETFPVSPVDVPSMIRQVARFLKVEAQGEVMARQLETVMDHCHDDQRASPDRIRRKFIYFIWTNPWMVVSKDTYISRMLELFGWENVVDDSVRYPEMTVEEMRIHHPDILIFSTEPWPFRKRDLKRLHEEWPDCPESVLADGRLFSWYGSTTMPACLELNQWTQGKKSSMVRSFCV